MPKLVTIPRLSWQCPQCGRFIREKSIREEDYLDPGSYYGVGTRTWYDCSACGTVEREPVLVRVGDYSWLVDRNA